MPPFFFHYELYYQAKKHPIGSHVALTYFLCSQLAGFAAMFVIALLGALQDYVFKPSNPFHPGSRWALRAFSSCSPSVS